MAREKEFFRENLARLDEMYPDKEYLSVEEAAKYFGVERRAVTARIERRVNPLPAVDFGKGGKNRVYRIPKLALANFA